MKSSIINYDPMTQDIVIKQYQQQNIIRSQAWPSVIATNMLIRLTAVNETKMKPNSSLPFTA